MNQKKPVPPKLADRFFLWYCSDELSETILGDLHEDYCAQFSKKGSFRSKVDYWLLIFRFINRFTLSRKKNRLYQSNTIVMLRNYLLVTFRGLWKNRSYTSINTLGLAIGLASCIIIFFYVQLELSFDNFHSNKDRIFRITNTFERSSGSIHWARTPPALAPAIKNNIPGIENVTRLRYADDHLYGVGKRVFNQGNVFYADSSFFQIFDFKLKAGNSNHALSSPNSIVISSEMASKFFNSEDPLGQIITFDKQKSLVVTGVLEPLPENSHIMFDMLISFNTYEVPEGYLADLNSWSWAGFHTYALLAKNATQSDLQAKILALYNENFNRVNIDVTTELQPLTSIYLNSNHYTNVGESIESGNKSTIYTLSIIAILILVMSGFNFTNLSTALSLGRGKEVGIRKAMGAARSGVLKQFLFESLIVSMISLILSIVIVVSSQNFLKELLGLSIPKMSTYFIPFVFFLGITLFIGLFSGLYPAIVISSFKPISALKGNLKTSNKGSLLRNSLIVFQFTISVGLIAGSFLVFNQMKFIQNKNLGFDKENIIQVKVLQEDMADHYTELKNRFLQHPEVMNVAMTSHSFDGSSSSSGAHIVGTPEDKVYQLAYYQTDHDFKNLTNLKMVAGRYFSKDFPSDSSGIVLNETAVKLMELENPIGTKLNITRQEKSVIGVVKDFHFNSLHAKIAPLAIILPFTNTELMLVKVKSGNFRETLTLLENDWSQVVGSVPFDTSFLDDGIEHMYEQEVKLSKLTTLFTVLAIMLACMGLYGLVAFSIQSRTKEVGIRKVLGASPIQILKTLTKKFLLLILTAILLSLPIIYFLGELWLENFSYRIDMPWWNTLIAGSVLLVIAMITISQQTIKAANTNPTNVLRIE